MEVNKERPIRKKRRRRRRINRNLELAINLSVFAICVVTGIILAFQYFNREDVKLSEVTKLTLTGYDSRGRIRAEMNAEAVDREITQLQQILDTVEVGFSKEEKLANGEKIQITYSYDTQLAKKLGIKVKAEPVMFTVENLPTAKKISLEELFEDVTLTFSGTAPGLQVSINNESNHPYIKTMDFVIRDEKEYYEKGDVITVEAVFSEEEAINYQYEIENGKDGYCKSYPIQNVDSYLTNAEQLSEENLDILIAEGQKCFADANQYGLRIFSEAGCMPIWVNNKTTFTWENPYVISAYFNTAVEDAFGTIGTMVNDVKIVYGVTLMQANGVSCDAEIVVRFDGLMEKADGTIDLALDTGSMISASHKDKFIKDIVRNTYADEQYDSERIL